PSKKVYEMGLLVKTFSYFSTNDTTVNVKDYFITYKKNGAYIEGFLENAFDDNKGTFKSTGDVKIEIEKGAFSVN
ncbi:MAG: hypothetical protein ACOVP5_06945, partial [Chitinophagales bacterium]